MVFYSVMSQAAELNMSQPPGVVLSLVVLVVELTVLEEDVGSPKQVSTS